MVDINSARIKSKPFKLSLLLLIVKQSDFGSLIGMICNYLRVMPFQTIVLLNDATDQGFIEFDTESVEYMLTDKGSSWLENSGLSKFELGVLNINFIDENLYERLKKS